MCITAEQAESLAVCYHAFTAAEMTDHRAIVVWGKMLLDAQRETGVEMHPNHWLQRVIEHANRQLTALAA